MWRLLPVGAEFEHQWPASLTSSSSRVTVHKFRVVGHTWQQPTPNPESVKLGETVHAVAARYRNPTSINFNTVDMFGRTVWQAEFDGEGPSPTYTEMLEEIGVAVTESTPEDEKKKNYERARSDTV